jgi:Protein of unknown function (DUF3606)
VSVNEPYEVNYWTKELGVTNEQLRELVREYVNTASPLPRFVRFCQNEEVTDLLCKTSSCCAKP